MDHKDPNEDNSNPSRDAVLIKMALVGADNARHDKVANGHARGTSDEDLLSTDLIDPEHGGNGEDEFEDADDAGSEEVCCVSGKLHVLEDEGPGRSVCIV